MHAFACEEGLPPRRYWGIHDIDLLFQGQAETVCPFRAAFLSRGYDKALVGERLRWHPQPQELEFLDPRGLFGTQPGLQRPAIEYYLTSRYARWGMPFAEKTASNMVPTAYRGTNPQTGRETTFILGGHHRAAAALLRGEDILMRVIRGPLALRRGRTS